jgi:hypothetical protein
MRSVRIALGIAAIVALGSLAGDVIGAGNTMIPLMGAAGDGYIEEAGACANSLVFSDACNSAYIVVIQ